MPRPPSALTKFIRSLPADLPVKEVIEKAKAKGFETSDDNVARVRKMASAKMVKKTASKSKKPAAQHTAKKTANKPAPLSKSDFIRQQPASMSAADVLAAGKKAGLTFTSTLVYMVRGKQTGKGKAKKSATNKADFVRRYPTLSPKDVVARGKVEGIKFNEHYVYNVRAKNKPTGKRIAPKTAPSKATPSKTPSTTSKAAFVRQHADLAPKAIVELAKAQGLKLEVLTVYNVRSADQKAAKRRAASKKATAPTTASGRKPATMSKADFIRRYPKLSAAQLVEKAKAEGIKLDANHVYTVRGYDKRAKVKKRAAKKLAVKPAIIPAVVKPVTVPKPPVAPKPTAAGSARIEDLLRAGAATLGFDRALEVIRAEQARLMAVLGA